MIFVCAGWQGWVLLLATFLARRSRRGSGLRRKTLLGIAEERGGRRGAGNAIANTGVAAIAALLAALTYATRAGADRASPRHWPPAASDTVASEIGKAWGRRTWPACRRRRCRPARPGRCRSKAPLPGCSAPRALGGAGRRRSGWFRATALLPIVVGATVGALVESAARRDARSTGHPQQRRAQLPQHRARGVRRGRRRRACCHDRPSRAAVLLELSRPFTLVAPALGFVSGAVTAAGAAPREPWTRDLLVYPAASAR